MELKCFHIKMRTCLPSRVYPTLNTQNTEATGDLILTGYSSTSASEGSILHNSKYQTVGLVILKILSSKWLNKTECWFKISNLCITDRGMSSAKCEPFFKPSMTIHWPQGDMAVILNVKFSNSLHKIVTWVFDRKVPSGECHRTLLMRNQHWLR